LGIFLCMKSAEIADTDDCCSDFLHHLGIMPRLPLKELYPAGIAGRCGRLVLHSVASRA
jgi:hypothetical protein